MAGYERMVVLRGATGLIAATSKPSAALNVGNAIDRKYLNCLYWIQAHYGAPRNASLRVGRRY